MRNLSSLPIFISVIIQFCSLGLTAQIGSKVQQQNTLHGIWSNNEYGFQMTLILQPDGTGEFDGEALTYKVEGNKLSINQDGAITTYSFSIQNEKLTLSGGDLDDPLSFSKNAGNAQVVEQPEKKIIPTYSDKIEPATTSGDLMDVWSAGNETIEFRSNGQCIYLGQSYPYKLSPGQVTLTTYQGDITFGYKVTGDQLSLSYNQNTINYSRGTGGVNAQQSQVSGEGRVDMELVGKWCYIDVSNIYGSSTSSTSTCITLNADGTYQYYGESSRSVNTPDFYGGTNSQNSDQGTWYVKGDRIYCNSQTQGPGSYKLEKRNHPKNVNDPMIVLDGTAYVTAYQKAPWR